MTNRYSIESLGESEYVYNTNDRAELDELKENAEKLLKRYTGTDKENKEQIFALMNEVLTYDDTDECEDPCEKFDKIKNEAAFALIAYQKIEMMHATSDHIDTLEIIDDAVKIELIETESTKEIKRSNTLGWPAYNIINDSVDTQFVSYAFCALYIHRKITEQWLTDSEKEEYSKLLGDSKFNHCQTGVEDEETYVKIEAYNILAATRLAKNILNIDY